MKKLLALLAFALLPVASFGAILDRDVLLTPAGTVYTAESIDNSRGQITSPSSRVIRLTIQRGDDVTTTYVPASLLGAKHIDPSLAYDSASDTLFVFWQKTPNPMSSELLFCSLHGSEWSEATSIDRASFNIRFGMKIAATRYAFTSDADGKTVREKALTIHAVWWEQTGYGEEARYAMLSLNNGKVESIDLRRLTDFSRGFGKTEPDEVDGNFDRSFFRYPSIFPNASNDGVEVLFADWERNRLQRVGIRPVIGHGVIRVPDGVWRGEIGAPRSGFRVLGDVTTVQGSGETLAVYTRNDKHVEYMLYRNATWSNPTRVAITQHVTADTAVEALKALARSAD